MPQSVNINSTRSAKMDASEIPEHNRRMIQDALNKSAPGEEVNVDTLPLLRRADGRAPIAVLCTVPRSMVLLPSEALAKGYTVPEGAILREQRIAASSRLERSYSAHNAGSEQVPNLCRSTCPPPSSGLAS